MSFKKSNQSLALNKEKIPLKSLKWLSIGFGLILNVALFIHLKETIIEMSQPQYIKEVKTPVYDWFIEACSNFFRS